MNNIEILGTRLKQLRQEKKLTQKQLADKAGITSATISAYEKATKNPSLDIIIKIANCCDVSIDWLCGNDNNQIVVDNLGDVAKLFIELDKCIEFDVSFESNDDFINYAYIKFKRGYFGLGPVGDYIINFLTRWENVRQIHKQGIINDELYERWVEAEFEEQSKISLRQYRESIEDPPF